MTKKIDDAILINPPAEVSLKDQALAELNKVEAGIADLEKQFKGKIYEVSTTKGMDEGCKARQTIRECRYKIPHIIKDTKQQLKVIGAAVETEGERIINALLDIENPIHEQIKAEEARKEKEKEEKAAQEKIRKDNIVAAIQPFRDIVTTSTMRTSDEIRASLELVESAQITEDKFQEYFDEAVMAKTAAVAGLNVLLEKALAAEEEARRLVAERLELEELRRQQEEMKRKLEEIVAADQKRIEEERAKVEQERKAEQEKFEQEQARARAEMKAEQERQQRELAEKMLAAQAEQERQQAEMEKQQQAAQAEIDRQRAELEEAQRIQRDRLAEEERKKNEPEPAVVTPATSAPSAILPGCAPQSRTSILDVELHGVSINVEFYYTPPSRGEREAGTGLQLSPDEGEEFEIIKVIYKDCDVTDLLEFAFNDIVTAIMESSAEGPNFGADPSEW